MLSTASSWPFSSLSNTFATTSKAASSPSSLTTNHSPLPLPALLSAHPVRLNTCPSSVSFPPTCAMSVEKITLSQMHSLGQTFLLFSSRQSTIVRWPPIRPLQTKLLPIKPPSLALVSTTSSSTTVPSFVMSPWVNLDQ